MTEPLVYACPFCGCEVRVGSSCPGCEKKKRRRRKSRAAAEPRHSWEQDESCDGLDLPDDNFDYDDFVAREFGKAPHKSIGVKWYWWLLGVVLLVAMLAWALRM